MEILNEKKNHQFFNSMISENKNVNIYSFDVLIVQKNNNNHLYSLT